MSPVPGSRTLNIDAFETFDRIVEYPVKFRASDYVRRGNRPRLAFYEDKNGYRVLNSTRRYLLVTRETDGVALPDTPPLFAKE